jgi:steroid 5-alpha reductase family enzyme
MLSFWVSFFCIGIFVATAAYLIARKVKLMAIVDTIWTAGLGISALVYHTVAGLESIRSWAVLLVIVLWSFRLSFHLFRDRIFTGHEDPRYKALAEHWGAQSARNFYFLFLAQIICIALFLFPVSIAMQNPQPFWVWTDTLAVLIGISAMLGEWIADRQLATFRANPKNKGGVCKDRLWRYSRHPNYFFEWLHWFAYLAFAMGSSSVGFALVGPIAMFIFLRFLTGVPYAEMSSLKSRGEAYRQYQSSTNAFFPWIPRDKTT